MGAEPIHPTDLLIAPDDPFDALQGYAPAWPYRSMSLQDPRLYYVRLFATQPRECAETAALGLGQRLSEGAYEGLILDYRGAEIAHDPQTFPAIADAFAGAFPPGLLIGYVYDRANFVCARLMVRLLRDRKLKAARARDFETAWLAIASAKQR